MLLKAALMGMTMFCTACMGLIAYVTVHPAMFQTAAAQPMAMVAPVVAPPPPPPPRVHVLTVSRALRTGALLHSDDFATADFAPEEVPQGAQIDSPNMRADLIGALVRHPIANGQHVLLNDIVRPGDHGFLALALAPGKRAISLNVDLLSGAGNMIWPGDRVDVVLTQVIILAKSH